MHSNLADALPEVKHEPDASVDSKSLDILDKTLNDPVEVEVSPLEVQDQDVGGSANICNDAGVSSNVSNDAGDSLNVSNQLVVYNPGANDTVEAQPVMDDTICHAQALNSVPVSNTSSRVMPSVGAFTVQCASCFKWRLIPSKEKYEAIRETIMEDPFVCEKAREWRPDISCEDPADISQDNSRLWAIDKPNISQPPHGWQRLLRIRSEGSTKFADVYYVAPCGRKLRSMVEIQKYLLEHPAYIEAGVNMSQFSYQTPKPLQEGYVRKRPLRPQVNNAAYGLPRSLEPTVVNPLSWARPDTLPGLEIAGPAVPSGYLETPVFQPPTKRRPKEKPQRQMYNSVYNQPSIKVEGSQLSPSPNETMQ